MIVLHSIQLLMNYLSNKHRVRGFPRNNIHNTSFITSQCSLVWYNNNIIEDTIALFLMNY